MFHRNHTLCHPTPNAMSCFIHTSVNAYRCWSKLSLLAVSVSVNWTQMTKSNSQGSHKLVELAHTVPLLLRLTHVVENGEHQLQLLLRLNNCLTICLWEYETLNIQYPSGHSYNQLLSLWIKEHGHCLYFYVLKILTFNAAVGSWCNSPSWAALLATHMWSWVIKERNKL